MPHNGNPGQQAGQTREKECGPVGMQNPDIVLANEDNKPS
jgi:hypothetical protein